MKFLLQASPVPSFSLFYLSGISPAFLESSFNYFAGSYRRVYLTRLLPNGACIRGVASARDDGGGGGEELSGSAVKPTAVGP